MHVATINIYAYVFWGGEKNRVFVRSKLKMTNKMWMVVFLL